MEKTERNKIVGVLSITIAGVLSIFTYGMLNGLSNSFDLFSGNRSLVSVTTVFYSIVLVLLVVNAVVLMLQKGGTMNAQAKRVCASCGNELKPDQAFCDKCGVKQ